MSLERLVIPRGLVAFRAPAAPAPVGTPTPAPVQSGTAGGLSVGELKDLQRRAFERGCEFERRAIATRFSGLLVSLERAIEQLEHDRATDRAACATFAVEVALGVADQLVGSAVRDGAHDVRKIVETLLHEALPALGDAALVVALNPADLSDLEALRAQTGGDGRRAESPLGGAGGRVQMVADAVVPRAGCLIRAAGAELSTDVQIWITAIAKRLRAVAREDGKDA